MKWARYVVYIVDICAKYCHVGTCVACMCDNCCRLTLKVSDRHKCCANSIYVNCRPKCAQKRERKKKELEKKIKLCDKNLIDKTRSHSMRSGHSIRINILN